ncbi:MAG: DUF1501 domain-containing protein [Planctomycetaceae bacterium]|nr:DUF1501 domain-containing protein [Planctomycetaceae bacterium]
MSTRRFCDGFSRRDMLRVGLGGMAAGQVTLPQLLQAGEHAAGRSANGKDDVSLIVLFLKGGLSTIDTLDLKPDAPPEFRGDFQPVSSRVPGMDLCEHLPALSQVADHFSLLRHFTHTNSGHGPADHWMLTGYAPLPGFNPSISPNNQRPSHGSVISRKLGPRGGVPPYVCLPKMHPSAGAAYLGSSAAPFVVNSDPSAADFSVPDLMPPLEVDAGRLDDRRLLLGRIDRYRASAELTANTKARALSTFQEKAFELVTSAATRTAFDIAREPDELRDRYGRHSLGQSCLMARRLVEAGVRCVTIEHTNWDTHYNNFDVLKKDLLPQLDTGLPMLFRDLSERGMLDSTLVLVMGEFGRTPRVNKDAGRDHWGPSNTILLGGGGIRGGLVLGKTNSRGERPEGPSVGPADLSATIFRQLGIDYTEEFITPEGRPVAIVDDGHVIDELL